MDSSEFPSLTDSRSNSMDKSTLGSSWAEVAQPHPHEEHASSANVVENKVESNLEASNKKVDHRPGVWETTKENATFADIAGHEKKQADEFPTPQESLAKIDIPPAPASGGVGDLLHSPSYVPEQDPLLPPNPDRSFAAVTSHEGFPKPEHDASPISEEPPLSSLPDVKDMLEKPSVHIPPVPKAKSFAKVAATEIPPEKRPLSERAINFLKNQPSEKDEPLAMTDENFPTLGQSNLMAEHRASIEEERAVYSEISRFNQLNEDLDPKFDPTLPKSFADITGSNLENAPPSAIPHVDQHPVYDEELVYQQNEKREERKTHHLEQGNNEQLIKEENEMDVTPAKILKEELKKEHKTTEKIETKQINAEKSEAQPEKAKDNVVRNRGMGQKSRGVTDDAKDEDALSVRLHTFDKSRTGVITIFDTITALYRLGHSWLTIVPGAYLMHLRLSPLTSPHRFPFIYRSISDLILLPIYTRNLKGALAYKTPMLHQGKDKVNTMVEKYGHKSGSSKGLGYWDGLRAMRSLEQNSLRWWQIGLWAVHRVQWSLAYTMLHEPKSNIVTAPTLIALSSD
ncbi:uncharacterized protein EV154DRAFT_491637 [Mucor mucedo]|uniref:uncharacterized protein n=1 Tax=Mucor mucedo TaxID=29922 RepID=UPI00221EA972|nr:uncharacterized protein EV154DRAFT_491637 [Mucor mucedo]KAI7896620.1 hypothetical protein EV154DRAFT_491637 [Mucor mucedo]